MKQAILANTNILQEIKKKKNLKKSRIQNIHSKYNKIFETSNSTKKIYIYIIPHPQVNHTLMERKYLPGLLYSDPLKAKMIKLKCFDRMTI